MNSKEIRESFFSFFRDKHHRIVESAPMVIKNDPTLMFTNAGMNQFKDIFLGNEVPSGKRVANTQKCLRVSGKHNDLEEVGKDTYHHTMFEMLGNWSFGDYFKKEAIEWAWEYLTSVLGIAEDRLYTTVFEGSPGEGLERDNEAASYWEKCFPGASNRILNGSKKDNFWEMGDSGPCGPCSEIHVDIRDDIEREKTPGHLLVNQNHPLVIEIWNLVFIQYNRKSDGALEKLPDRHVDTGMGFERLCMVVQGKKSNYDTDIFQSLISEIGSITGRKYGESEGSDIAMRVIADHLRAVAFSIADGQMPSNNKAGYVIRRILRRAIRYGYNYLGTEDPFIYRLVPVLIKTMGKTFPELKSQEEHITRVLLQEETTFLHTLGKGIKLIEKRIIDLKAKGTDIFPGEDAFTLYDTFGFPIDLTQLILTENGMKADVEGFENEMKRQKERSRNDAARETDDWVILRETVTSEFTGYSTTSDEIRITRYRRVKSKGKNLYHMVFDRTPFYAESGGQIGDTGFIENENHKVVITDTIKENNLTIHISESLPENPEAVFTAVVDRTRRDLIACNHTATHLLHHALRKVLGMHVEQKGSLVTAEKLRFDFSHFEKLNTAQLREIERIVNQLVRKNLKSDVESGIAMSAALERGAIALFGEKYSESVRLVTFGDSVELCGGTHVGSTSSIGLFRIISEGAIAAGIRRIEAITSDMAYQFIDEQMEILDEISNLLKNPKDITGSISKLLNENRSLRSKNEKMETEVAAILKNQLEKRGTIINGIRSIIEIFKADSVEMMKQVASQLRATGESVILVGASEIDGKAVLIIMISDDLIREKKMDAAKIIREISPEINGSGGGQPFLAVAGGNKPAGISSALSKAREIINRL